jgi:hypothetical protein
LLPASESIRSSFFQSPVLPDPAMLQICPKPR